MILIPLANIGPYPAIFFRLFIQLIESIAGQLPQRFEFISLRPLCIEIEDRLANPGVTIFEPMAELMNYDFFGVNAIEMNGAIHVKCALSDFLEFDCLA